MADILTDSNECLRESDPEIYDLIGDCDTSNKHYECLRKSDPEIYDLIVSEKKRQINGLELIASENFTSQAVMETLASCFVNKYAEGYPGKRYYGGTQHFDSIERLCQKRALELFKLDPEEWGVNVQPYSGSVANFAVYTALLSPRDALMGLDLPSGGHLTHGYAVPTKNGRKNITSSSIYFDSYPYTVDPETGLLNYDMIENEAKKWLPDLLIVGASAYPRDFDYERFFNIAMQTGSYLMADIAHISGLVATGEHNNPFDYCDVVTTTTHKTLRGPRGALIFYRKSLPLELEQRINSAVFPGMQGGPHGHSISAIAVSLKEANTPEYHDYIVQVKRNAKALADRLMEKGYKLVTNGTDNHLILMDLRPLGLTGSKVEKAAEMANITLNKNSVYGETNARRPGGIRIGTPALTSRGLKDDDFRQIADYLDTVIQECIVVQKDSGKLLKHFVPALEKSKVIQTLQKEVYEFSRKFPIPGIGL